MKSAFALDSAELWNHWLIEVGWGERILLFAKAKRSKNFYMVALRADFFVDSSRCRA